MWGVVFTACVVFFSAHKVIASILKYSVLWIPTDYMLPCQTLRMQRFYVLGGRNIALGVSIAANPMQRIHWIATLLPFQFLPLIPSFSNATILIYTSTLLPFQLLPLTPSFSNATIPIYTSTLLPFQFLPLIPSFSNATILIYLSFPSLQVKDFLTKPYVPITGRTPHCHFGPHPLRWKLCVPQQSAAPSPKRKCQRHQHHRCAPLLSMAFSLMSKVTKAFLSLCQGL